MIGRHSTFRYYSDRVHFEKFQNISLPSLQYYNFYRVNSWQNEPLLYWYFVAYYIYTVVGNSSACSGIKPTALWTHPGFRMVHIEIHSFLEAKPKSQQLFH